MKKIVLTFGVISGIISAVLMLCTVPFLDHLGHGSTAAMIGYTCMVLSFLLVFFGIRSYRDNVGAGRITFGRAFAVGICITLISCAFYVVTWEIVYFNFLHGMMDPYFASMVQKAQASGHSGDQIAKEVASIRHSQQLYENPLINSLYTFIEPFPVGLLITLISAAFLRKTTVSGATPSQVEATA